MESDNKDQVGPPAKDASRPKEWPPFYMAREALARPYWSPVLWYIIGTLRENDATVAFMHFFLKKRLVDVARMMRLSPTRIGQIRNRVIRLVGVRYYRYQEDYGRAIIDRLNMEMKTRWKDF